MNKSNMCKLCKFETTKLFNLNRHNNSRRHLEKLREEQRGIREEQRGIGEELRGVNELNSNLSYFECPYCQKSIAKNNKSRHLNSCKLKTVGEKTKDELIKKLQTENEKITEDQKKLQIENDKIIKRQKEIEEEYYTFLKNIAVKNGSAQNNTIINNNTVNVGCMNVSHINKTYTEAFNYEDLMTPKLTKAEKRHIRSFGPTAGCERLIINRCVDGIDKEKRPFHCLDLAREKFAFRTNNRWEIDWNGVRILQPAFEHVRTLFDISDNNKDINDRVDNQQMLLHMDMKGAKKITKFIGKQTMIKNS